MTYEWVLKRKKCWICFVMGVLLCGMSCRVLAKNYDVPSDVKVVKNEKEMLDLLIKGMKKHRSQFALYYPGIEKDFKNYHKKSATYTPFVEKLAAKDGYIVGSLSGYCITICGNETRYVIFQFCYSITKKQERRVNKEVKKIVKRIGKGNTALKVKRAHDYLIQHMSYDDKYYTSYHAFVKRRGVCMAYALAYQRLLQEMKIPCIYVEGQNHAWNMVKINKYWYNVDVTWDDQSENQYRYFLKSDAVFAGHKKSKNRKFNLQQKAKYSYDLNKIH